MRSSLPLLGVAAWAVAAPLSAGVYFSAVTIVTREGGAAPARATARVWVQGDRARLEFPESGNPLLRSGRFLLTLDGGRSIYLVDPTERTFSLWSGEAGVWSAAAAASAAGAGLEKVADEDGGELLGVATRHRLYRAAAAAGAAAGKAPQAGVVEEELWVAPELAEGALGVWLSAAARSGGRGAGTASPASERFADFPLKLVATAKATGKGGGRTVVTTTTVTEVSVEELAPSTFTMGSGYREKALAPLPSGDESRTGDEAVAASQEDQQYPFDQMAEPQPQPGAPTTRPSSQPGQAGAVTQPGARPAPPPTPVPPPVVEEEPPQDPEYPFELMLDSPER